MTSVERRKLYRFLDDSPEAPVFVKVPQLALTERRPINNMLRHGVYYRASALDINQTRPSLAFGRSDWITLHISDKEDDKRRLNALKENSACVSGLDWEWYTISAIGSYERIV